MVSWIVGPALGRTSWGFGRLGGSLLYLSRRGRRVHRGRRRQIRCTRWNRWSVGGRPVHGRDKWVLLEAFRCVQDGQVRRNGITRTERPELVPLPVLEFRTRVPLRLSPDVVLGHSQQVAVLPDRRLHQKPVFLGEELPGITGPGFPSRRPVADQRHAELEDLVGGVVPRLVVVRSQFAAKDAQCLGEEFLVDLGLRHAIGDSVGSPSLASAFARAGRVRIAPQVPLDRFPGIPAGTEQSHSEEMGIDGGAFRVGLIALCAQDCFEPFELLFAEGRSVFCGHGAPELEVRGPRKGLRELSG